MDSKGSMGLRIYPRGFLGGINKPQVVRTPKPFGDQAAQQQYSVNDSNNSAKTIAPNPYVESLYAGYIKNSVNTSSNEFRTSVLEAALEAFGTNNFAVWYAAQHHSLAAGNLHSKFLEDTLYFISYGTRKMSLETWGALIVITDEGDPINDLPKSAKEFFGIGGNSAARTNSSLVEVIQQWCSKPSGLEDLLGTLHILFGNP